MRWPPVLTALCAAALLLVVAAASPAASTKQRLQAKQAEARQVLAQVNALDEQFGAAAEAYDGARYELQLTRRRLAAQKVALRFAQDQRRLAIQRLTRRLVALYADPDQSSTIAILLGATNLNDLIDQLAAAKQVTQADHDLAVRTTAARNAAADAEQRLQATEAQRAAAVTRASAARAQIGSMLTERKRLLSSVQSQVVTLQAQERRQQEILREQARERLAREMAAARAAAAARARVAAEAQRKAEAAVAQPATTQAAPTPAAPDPATSTTQTTPPPSDPVATTTATTTTAPAPTPLPAPSPLPVPALGAGHPEAAQIAMRYLGIKYRWGGASPATGFDCSGLVMYVYAQLGISLPHFAAAQYQLGVPVPRDQLQPGDLVFFDGLNHVGIYIGGGEMIHAPHTGDVVKIEAISDFGAGYVGARRI